MVDNSKIIQGLMRINDLSEEELYDLICFDINHGITFFDLADCYGNGLVEEKMGNVLSMHKELRDKIFIQTKCSVTRSDVGTYYDLSYKYIIEAVDNSLKRLKIDYIDSLLPYYLKTLEVLIHHYTVPVAIARSIDDAPAVFKPGLKELVAKIEAGDSSIQPYTDFANRYPVRDSMRMMRLLYRLGLGEQERKHQQLLSFSKSVSSLQEKAREQKYKNRLHRMESMTMIMLVCTGGGGMLLLLVSMFMMLAAAM